MNMELIPLELIMETPICSWKGSMSTIMKLQVINILTKSSFHLQLRYYISYGTYIN